MWARKNRCRSPKRCLYPHSTWEPCLLPGRESRKDRTPGLFRENVNWEPREQAECRDELSICLCQLQKLLEILEIHLIQEVMRKVNREITLIVSGKSRSSVLSVQVKYVYFITSANNVYVFFLII